MKTKSTKYISIQITARRTFFAKNVYLNVNFLLEISKFKFRRPQLCLAAGSRRKKRAREMSLNAILIQIKARRTIFLQRMFILM